MITKQINLPIGKLNQAVISKTGLPQFMKIKMVRFGSVHIRMVCIDIIYQQAKWIIGFINQIIRIA